MDDPQAVGIVLVSHSAELAQAVKALAEQQTQGKARIAAVGGTGDPEHPFGTDAVAIMEAIESLYSADGVLVLMDLGSALLSAETALELLGPGEQAHVRLSQAPFVEGAMAAAVQASIGADLEAVAREAAAALRPKAESLGGEGAAAGPADAERPEAGVEEAVATARLANPAGLHFRPAAVFVQAAAAWPAQIDVRNATTGGAPADAKRFNQVLGLGGEQGHEIEIRAHGPEAQAAVEALAALLGSGFGESDAFLLQEPGPTVTGRGRSILRGTPASPGVALGVAYRLPGGAVQPPVPPHATRTPDVEWARYQVAAGQARAELAGLAARTRREAGEPAARIFEAHASLLDDPDMAAAVWQGIKEQGLNAEEAVDRAAGAGCRRAMRRCPASDFASARLMCAISPSALPAS